MAAAERGEMGEEEEEAAADSIAVNVFDRKDWARGDRPVEDTN